LWTIEKERVVSGVEKSQENRVKDRHLGLKHQHPQLVVVVVVVVVVVMIVGNYRPRIALTNHHHLHQPMEELHGWKQQPEDDEVA
jgi:hypothetical protein